MKNNHNKINVERILVLLGIVSWALLLFICMKVFI